MRQKKILHIIAPNKFTIPFIHFINKEFNSSEHLFLCVIKPEDDTLKSNANVRFLYTPYRNNIIRNLLIFYKSIKGSSKIILHGNPVLFYFILFPWILKKTYWIIYGYELEITSSNSETKISSFHSFIKRFVLKRVFGHITHIEGDSELANRQFKSSAKFYYSPMYLSNVITDNRNKIISGINKTVIKKILVGNSTSPTNNHSEIFKMLLPYKDDNILIYCPLSYGIYNEYRDNVIRIGKELFGDKFISINKFMEIDEYTVFLQDIDVAIFNHERQEGMGVTLILLNAGKILYMNSNTTSYRSLRRRGIKVFDNTLLIKEGLYKQRDVSINPSLVYRDYNYEKLRVSFATIFDN